MTYQFEKIRSYQIDQPSSATELAIKSTDAGDTSQTLTVENEGSSTSEDVSLNGTTLVSTSNTYANVDVLSLDSETAGDIQVYINSGTQASPTQGDQISVIKGSGTYNSIEGDLGVPALGTGSHASALGSSYEIFLGDTVERPSGTSTWAFDIASTEFSVNNNLETTIRSDSMRQRIHVGNQDIEVAATVMGETESHSQIIEHLEKTENDVVWTLDNSTLTAGSAALTDSPSRTIEAGQATLSLDATFTGQSLTVA